MTTKAEIEAEIARLQSRLQRTEIDPEFTPKELVRWDPSLIGTLLCIQHYKDIPANAFDIFYSDKPYDVPINEIIKSREWFGRSRPDFEGTKTSCAEWAAPSMDSYAVLTNVGCKTHIGFNYNDHEMVIWPPSHQLFSIYQKDNYRRKWEDKNQFEHMTVFITNLDWGRGGTHKLSQFNGGNMTYYRATLPCRDYKLKYVELSGGGRELHVPLADPDKSLLDQIFIATSTKIPGLDKEIIINNYPLSTLYKEWKADKDAGRTLRKTPLVEAHETIATLRKELQALKTDRDASLDKRDKLANALHIASNMICTTDPL